MISVLNMSNLLYNSNDADEAIIECIDAKIDGIEYPLNESIDLFPKISEYSVLIEAVDELSEVKKDIKNIKNEDDPKKIGNIFDKIIKSAKKAFNWWYKVDPNKKYKTLHTILKLLVAILEIIFIFKGPGQKTLINKITKVLPVGYEGANKVLKTLFSKATIASAIVGAIYGQIVATVNKISDKIEASANKKDIDKSIAEYDKTVDMLNKMIEEIDDPQMQSHLKATKIDVEQALADLIKIKERLDKKNNKRDD